MLQERQSHLAPGTAPQQSHLCHPFGAWQRLPRAACRMSRCLLHVAMHCTASCVLTLHVVLPLAPFTAKGVLILAWHAASHRSARCPPPPHHEWHLTCRLVCLHGVECPRSSRALCSPALCLLYAVSCIAVCCAVSCTRPPLPPAAAPGSSCDPRGMCLGNYSPDRARGLGAELGEVQAEGGPRRQSPRTGQQGHSSPLRTGSWVRRSCWEFFPPLGQQEGAGRAVNPGFTLGRPC